MQLARHAFLILVTLGLACGVPSRGTQAETATPSEMEQADTPFRLIMVEQAGCAYCKMWNDELGPIYPKTPEGQLAPLEHVDLRSDWAADLEIGPKPIFTPTFILLENSTEVGRIEGYPGEDFFWGLLGMALRDAGAPLPAPD